MTLCVERRGVSKRHEVYGEPKFQLPLKFQWRKW